MPVAGLRPFLAGLADFSKVANPGRVTLLPLLTLSVIALIVASMALAASAFVNPAFSAIAATRSVLFIVLTLLYLFCKIIFIFPDNQI